MYREWLRAMRVEGGINLNDELLLFFPSLFSVLSSSSDWSIEGYVSKVGEMGVFLGGFLYDREWVFCVYTLI